MIEQLDPYISLVGKKCRIETNDGNSFIAYLINKEGNDLTFTTDIITLKKRDIKNISIKEI